jgi:sulfatase maturation enzyme AslB (radical SAM superfamily)
MIHGGLELSLKDQEPTAQHCCLRNSKIPIDTRTNFWNDPGFEPLRKINQANKWDPGCENCKNIESTRNISFRLGMNDGLVVPDCPTGPARIDLMFDISCNLACRTCSPKYSTFWQKHLKDNGQWDQPVFAPKQYNEIITALEQLDLSNLQMLVFCGGETLLGQTHWDVVKWLVENVPNAKQKLTLCFQTNGTQPIHPRNYDLIDRVKLVKLHISLDGIGARFEYLRWPATWSKVIDNMLHLRDTVPSNVMFLVEETVSTYNLFYINELEYWLKENFITNREGDVVNHTRHLAFGIQRLGNCTQEYVDAMQSSVYQNLIPGNWKENPEQIHQLIAHIKQFDQIRNQSFQNTFPEVAEFYARYW